MRAAEHWKDFEVLDTSGGEKLERWGNVILARPDPQIIWNTMPTVCRMSKSLSSSAVFMPST